MLDEILNPWYISDFAKHLAWSMPYEHDVFTDYQASVLSYNFSIPGDQYRIDPENQTVAAILFSIQTDPVTDTEPLLNEILTPIYANRFLTGTTLYISAEARVAVLAIEGDEPVELQGDIIEESNNPALFIFGKHGFRITNVTFTGFSEVYLIANSINEHFSLQEQQNLSNTLLHSYFQAANCSYPESITINGYLTSNTKAGFYLYTGNFACSGLIETDALRIYLNSGDNIITPNSLGCTTGVTSFEIISVTAPLGITAPVTAINVTIKTSHDDVMISDIIQANNFRAEVGSLSVNQQGQVITTQFNTKDGLLESGNITITAQKNVSVEGKLYSGALLDARSENMFISGKLESIKNVRIEAGNMNLTDGSMESNGAIGLVYNMLTTTNTSIIAGDGLALYPQVAEGCTTSLEFGTKLIGSTISTSSTCPIQINSSALIASGDVNFSIQNYFNLDSESSIDSGAQVILNIGRNSIISGKISAKGSMVVKPDNFGLLATTGFLHSKAGDIKLTNFNNMSGIIYSEAGATEIITNEPLIFNGAILSQNEVRVNGSVSVIISYKPKELEASWNKLGFSLAFNEVANIAVYNGSVHIESDSTTIKGGYVFAKQGISLASKTDLALQGNEVKFQLRSYGEINFLSKQSIQAEAGLIISDSRVTVTQQTKSQNNAAIKFTKIDITTPVAVFSGGGKIQLEGLHNNLNLTRLEISETITDLPELIISAATYPYTLIRDVGNVPVILREQVICSGLLAIRTTGSMVLEGKILANTGVNLTAAYFDIRTNAIETFGETSFYLTTHSYVKFHTNSGIQSGSLTIQQVDGTRIALVDLSSATIQVTKANSHMNIKTDELVLKRTSEEIRQEPKNLPSRADGFAAKSHIVNISGNRIVVTRTNWAGEENCCRAFGSVYEEKFTGTKASLIYTNENVLSTIDALTIEVSASHFEVSKLKLEGENKTRLIINDIRALQGSVEGVGTAQISTKGQSDHGRHWCASAVSAVLKLAGHPTPPGYGNGQWPGQSTYPFQVSNNLVSTFTPKASITGKFEFIGIHNNGIYNDRFSQGAIAYSDNLKAITGVSYSASLETANYLNGLVKTAYNMPIVTLDPNRPVEYSKRPVKELNERNFPTAEYIENILPALASGQSITTSDYNYHYTQKYLSIFNCGIGIETILKQLNIPPEDAGKLFCEPNCQLRLVKEAIKQLMGFRDVADILTEVREYIKEHYPLDTSSLEKDCGEISWLLESALEQKDKLGLVVGYPLEESNRIYIEKPFIWLVYEQYKGRALLAPAVYFPAEMVKRGPMWKGSFIATTEANIVADAIHWPGALYIGRGSITVNQEVIMPGGSIVHTGSERLTMTASSLIMPRIVQTEVTTSGSVIDIRTTSQSLSPEITSLTGEFFIVVDNLLLKGIEVEGQVQFKVNENAFIVSSQEYLLNYAQYSNGYTKVAKVSNKLPTLDGKITLEVEGTFYGEGITVTSNSEFIVLSKRNLELVPAIGIDVQERFERREESRGISRTKEFTDHKLSSNITLEGNVIADKHSPAEKVEIHAERDINTKGLVVHAFAIDMRSKGSMNLAAGYEQQVSVHQVRVKEDGLVGFKDLKVITSRSSESLNSKTTITGRPTELNAYKKDDTTGNITLEASEKINGDSVQLNARDGVIALKGDHGINLMSVAGSTVSSENIQKEKESSFGATLNFEEATVGIFKKFKRDSIVTIQFDPIPTKITAQNLLLSSKDGNIVTQGVFAQYKDAFIEAVQHFDIPAVGKYNSQINSVSGELGAKIGFTNNFYSAIKATEAFVTAEGNAVNQGFAAYNAFAMWLKAVACPISFDVMVSARISNNELHINKVSAVPSQFLSAGKTTHKVLNLEMQGTQYKGIDWLISANQVKFLNAFSSYETKQHSDEQLGSFGIKFDRGSITGEVGLNLGNRQQSAKIAQNFHALLSGDLTINAEGEVRFEGATISANTIKLNVGNLILKSIESINKVHGYDSSLGLGNDFTTGTINPFLNRIGSFHEKGDSKWVSELTQVVAKEKAQLIINGMFHIVGSMVANAVKDESGNWIDKGNLEITAAQILAESVYGYDNGYTLGASLSLAASAGGIFGNGYGLKVGFKDLEQVLRPTIGKGDKKAEQTYGEINPDLNAAKVETGNSMDTLDIFYQSINWDNLLAELNKGTVVDRARDTVAGAWDKTTAFIDGVFGTSLNQAPVLPRPDDLLEGYEQPDSKESVEEEYEKQIIADLFEEIKELYGEEATALLAEGVKKAALYQQTLAKAEEGSYVIKDGKLIITLPEVGIIKANSVAASGLELAFEVVGEVANMPVTKGVLKVGKYVVRMSPHIAAALTAYEIGCYIFDQALAEKREDLILKSEETQAFANKIVEKGKTKEHNKNKIKQDVGGKYGSPNVDPDDFEPDKSSRYKISDDEFQKAKAEGRVKYEDIEYHGKVKRGIKDPAPKNPTKALEKSVRFAESTERRVSVDPVNNEYVVFSDPYRTPDGKWSYHGHSIKRWNDLEPHQQQALKNAKLVKRSGKIIK